jgi:hypothetical protein
MASAIALVPALAGSLVIRTWAGIDGAMPDHIPVIGFSATTPNLVHAFGFSGHGFQLGPLVGEIIAELITQGRSTSPLAPFAIERFADATAAHAGDDARGRGVSLGPSPESTASSAGYDAARRIAARARATPARTPA